MLTEKFIYAIITGALYESQLVVGVYASEVVAAAAASDLVENMNAEGDDYKPAKSRGDDDVTRWESSTGAYYVEVVRWPLNTMF